MDIAPTVLKRFGVDLSKIEPRLDGTPFDEPAERKIAPAENPNAKKKAAGLKKAAGKKKAGQKAGETKLN